MINSGFACVGLRLIQNGSACRLTDIKFEIVVCDCGCDI